MVCPNHPHLSPILLTYICCSRICVSTHHTENLTQKERYTKTDFCKSLSIINDTSKTERGPHVGLNYLITSFKNTAAELVLMLFAESLRSLRLLSFIDRVYAESVITYTHVREGQAQLAMNRSYGNLLIYFCKYSMLLSFFYKFLKH